MHLLFINSEHFWLNGWLNTPSSLKFAMDTLSSFGISVSCLEIRNSDELVDLLNKLPDGTLLWPNAYYTRNSIGEIVWLQEFIESRALPHVGTPMQGLKNMLHKSHTHQLLRDARVTIPDHLTISRSLFEHFDELIASSSLKWPLVVKPSSESCSMGILKANDAIQAKRHISQMFDEFPHSDALLETFLPSEDITFGYLELAGEIMLLPTYYQSRQVSGKTHVVERDLGSGPWGGDSIVMPPVSDNDTLHQLQDQMPRIAQAIGIAGISRVDARMDENGRLKFFDVNGMPALSYPKSVLVRQVRECFPGLSAISAYAYLLKTVIYITASRFGFDLPKEVTEQTLFSLKSPYVIRIPSFESV
jgi:D-alanine-D-alanine ligase-like ATP-grasp enzyme